MLTEAITPALAEQWKVVWVEYHGKLQPNRRSGEELLAFLSQKYVLTEIRSKAAAAVICGSVLGNAPLREKLPPGAVLN